MTESPWRLDGGAVLIDESPDMRAVLRLALARSGIAVVGEADDARAAIRVVRQVSPDLVVVEVRTPGLDSPTALPAIRRLVPNAHIVVLTTCATLTGAALARRGGADAYLVKGTPLRHVLSILRGGRRPLT